MKKINIVFLALSTYLYAPTCDVLCIIGAIKNNAGIYEGGIEIKASVWGNGDVLTQGDARAEIRLLRNNAVEATMMVYKKDKEGTLSLQSFKIKPRTLTVAFGKERQKLRMKDGRYCILQVKNFKTDEILKFERLVQEMREMVFYSYQESPSPKR